MQKYRCVVCSVSITEEDVYRGDPCCEVDECRALVDEIKDCYGDDYRQA